ncbi:MAG: hypothetical protein KJ718_00345 [Nanoarchaeota archaeon]|nr:hypothetical protein [Nanoarchaeota archaeon]MBU1050990.1 hypothetical protein [Nanoarchaeota archaeon]MBU1988031.1 hypothetical protein [Nanoarchaeota archaeon]
MYIQEELSAEYRDFLLRDVRPLLWDLMGSFCGAYLKVQEKMDVLKMVGVEELVFEEGARKALRDCSDYEINLAVQNVKGEVDRYLKRYLEMERVPEGKDLQMKIELRSSGWKQPIHHHDYVDKRNDPRIWRK